MPKNIHLMIEIRNRNLESRNKLINSNHIECSLIKHLEPQILKEVFVFAFDICEEPLPHRQADIDKFRAVGFAGVTLE